MSSLYPTLEPVADGSYQVVDLSANCVDLSANRVDVSANRVVVNLIVSPAVSTRLPLNPTLTDIFNAITTNPVFTEQIEEFVKTLQVNHGKMSASNVPNLVLLMMDLVEHTGEFNLSTASLPVVLKMVYEFVVNKYNLVPLNERPAWEEMFLSALNLLLRVPFKKNCNSIGRLFSCCK